MHGAALGEDIVDRAVTATCLKVLTAIKCGSDHIQIESNRDILHT